MKNLYLVLLIFLSSEVFALENSTKFVFKSAGYGALGGAVMGLAAVPILKSGRPVFMGSSIGLYLGAIAGLYFVNNKDQFSMLQGSKKPSLDPNLSVDTPKSVENKDVSFKFDLVSLNFQ